MGGSMGVEEQQVSVWAGQINAAHWRALQAQ
jgi:hypothetical protein